MIIRKPGTLPVKHRNVEPVDAYTAHQVIALFLLFGAPRG